MKRFFTFLVTSALIAAFCIAGFAESINSACAVACPGCDRGGLVTVKCESVPKSSMNAVLTEKSAQINMN